MPTVLRIGPYRFHFYTDEGTEPAHIHVRCADGECKFWLDQVCVASNRGLRPEQVREAERLVSLNRSLLKVAYEAIHSSKPG